MKASSGQRSARGGAGAAPAAARRARPRCVQCAAAVKVTFSCPRHTEFGQEVAVVGGADALGKWDAAAAVPLTWSEGDVWTATAELPESSTVEYKYIVVASGSGDVIEWQGGDNMVLETPSGGALSVRDAWEGGHEAISPDDGAAPGAEASAATTAAAAEVAAPAPAAAPEAAPAPAAAEAAAAPAPAAPASPVATPADAAAMEALAAAASALAAAAAEAPIGGATNAA